MVRTIQSIFIHEHCVAAVAAVHRLQTTKCTASSIWQRGKRENRVMYFTTPSEYILCGCCTIAATNDFSVKCEWIAYVCLNTCIVVMTASDGTNLSQTQFSM